MWRVSSNSLFCILHRKSILKMDQRKFTAIVEGNIASGKTTFLNYFSKFPSTTVIKEPVSMWRNLKGHNLLGLMYNDPSRWGLTFQTYVQLTMLDIHKRVDSSRIKLMERSLFSARNCFVENLFESGVMPEVEYDVLSEWYNWLIKNENIKVDLIVYLQTDPEVVYERIQQRNRKEELGISMDYLKKLHILHENWLMGNSKFPVPAPVMVLNANLDMAGMQNSYEKYCDIILGKRKHEKTFSSQVLLDS